MTNAELLAKIKAEIGRLKGFYNPDDFYDQAYLESLADVESFLSTLESEKPMNPDDAMKELDEKIALVKQRGTWDGVDVDKYMDEVRGREPEKPMNLEEEIIRTYHDGSVADTSDLDHNSYENIARHFAQWGIKSQEKKIADAYEKGKQEGIRIIRSWESSPGQGGY